jgi:hypothetical protein
MHEFSNLAIKSIWQHWSPVRVTFAALTVQNVISDQVLRTQVLSTSRVCCFFTACINFSSFGPRAL